MGELIEGGHDGPPGITATTDTDSRKVMADAVASGSGSGCEKCIVV